ncbi:hypothetical protein VXE65_32915 [Mycolicibacterium conceptionense]|uniref:hypothetical protein n=1 Tax=Mycolicibacterium conceptionense TaxID=451644 RepID=UPI003204919F
MTCWILFLICPTYAVPSQVKYCESTMKGFSMRASTSDALRERVHAAATPRELIVTWQHPIERTIAPVARLSYDGRRYQFCYIRNALRISGFRPFLGFPELNVCYSSDTLFPLFAQRAMAPRRPDFTRWVNRLGLPDDASPWEQITRSGGRRQGDTIQLFPIPTVADGRMECDFLVHGMRHIVDRGTTVGRETVTVTSAALERQLSTLRAGDELRLCDEPTNPSNPLAILTTTRDNLPLGWVPNLLVEELHRIPNHQSASVHALAVNGADAGWHLRLLAHLSVPVSEGFQVFAGEQWQRLTCSHEVSAP